MRYADPAVRVVGGLRVTLLLPVQYLDLAVVGVGGVAVTRRYCYAAKLQGMMRFLGA